ncbi:MAG: alpha/beta hydrolase [Chloroflexaceae bacterium]|nr:alpha/beta hydrolase [Chloroflexaceae bacterium]
MTTLAHLPGIRSRRISTARGRFQVLEAGDPVGEVVLFVHGNIAAATFWEETMLALPTAYCAIAPDLRGYGLSDRLPVDATRGMRDFSADLHTLSGALGLERFHLVGHSLGGCVAMQYAIEHPQRVRSLTLVAAGSPYGFGGTKDTDGTPCWPDYAGSGGGLIHPEWLQRLKIGDRSDDSNFSPLRMLRERLLTRPLAPRRESALLEAILLTHTDTDNYSRDLMPSTNWPGFAPGTRGVNNAISPRYCNLSALATITPRPPICWIRGDQDQVVADQALSDVGTLGAMGLIPGWPGVVFFPPQPMVSQLRAVLQRYRANGGTYQEHILAGTRHMPFLDDLAAFMGVWLPFLSAVNGR